MNTSDPAGIEQPGAEPTWDEKVLLLNSALAQDRLRFAFGGAIALNYHREPRATLDIDINVFLSPQHEAPVLSVLAGLYELRDPERLRTDLRRDGQARTLWGDTYVDLFLANTDFHESMAQRVEHQPFGGSEVPVLSIEDLLICKILFDRPKDWLDLEAVAQTRAQTLDRTYIMRWLDQFLEPDDPRLRRAQSLLSVG